PAQLNDRLLWRRISACGLSLLLLPWLPFCARGAQEGDFQFEIVDAGAVITSYIGPGGSVAIPDHLGGVPVTSLGYFAFSTLSLTSVTIPNSVTSIGSATFYGCTSLTNVTIPNSVTSIGSYVFYDCKSLTNVTIPNSVTSPIGEYAFSGCTGLASVTIGNGVTSIEGFAFQACTRITNVTIGNSVTSIVAAFYRCTNLTSVAIPNSVTFIGEYAF